jgi:hypothetical protein
MSNGADHISHEEIVELQKKFSEIKFAINNALAVMMARADRWRRVDSIKKGGLLATDIETRLLLSEMSQGRSDYSEKLASTVLTKAPLIVSSLQEFTQALNEKAGPKPQEEIVELQEKFWEIKKTINNWLAGMMALSEMSQGRPEFSEKLASKVLEWVPQTVLRLREFTQALNEKAGPKPEVGQ